MAPLVWLVTGCTSGFGEQFITAVLARGDKAIATGRDVSRMKHLKEAGAAVLELDVTASQSVLNAKVAEALKFYGKIDVLVNNAGYTQMVALEEWSHEKSLAIFNANLFGAINLTRAILPHFRHKRDGMVVFNGSFLAWTTIPMATFYSMTKAGLAAAVDGLQQEIAPLGIRCLLFEPGHFRTAIVGRGLPPFEVELPDYAEMRAGVRQYASSMNGLQPGDPRKAVEIVIDLVKKEGCAKGREIPLRLPFGQDASAAIRAKCQDTLKVLDEWKDVIESTNFDE